MRDSQVQRISGRQMYVSHMAAKFNAFNESKLVGGQRLLSWQKIWSFHGQEWKQLSAEQHRRFEAQAAGLRSERAARNEQELRAAQTKKQALLAEIDSGPSMLVPMTFAACKLSAQDFEDMGCFRPRSLPASSGTGSARSLLQACPPPVSDDAFHQCMERSDLAETLVQSTSLLRSACALRDILKFTVLEAVCEEECYYFLFSLIVKRPCEITLLRLLEVDQSEAELSCTSMALRDGNAQPRPVKCFKYEGGFFAESSLWQSLDGCRLNIYANALFCGLGVVAVFSGAESLTKIVDAHVGEGINARQQRTEESTASTGRSGQAVDASSWIIEAFARSRSAAIDTSHPDNEKESTGEGDNEDSNDDEIMSGFFEAVAHERAERREDMRSTLAESLSELFRWQVMGGSWQMERTGRSLYGVRVDIKAATSLHAFSSRFRLGLSASFEYNVYTEAHAEGFARLWAERILTLYEHYSACGESAEWTGRTCGTTTLSAELGEVLATLPKRAQTRVARIQVLRP
eukprot:821360-Amphidinium_carterae.2